MLLCFEVTRRACLAAIPLLRQLLSMHTCLLHDLLSPRSGAFFWPLSRLLPSTLARHPLPSLHPQAAVEAARSLLALRHHSTLQRPRPGNSLSGVYICMDVATSPYDYVTCRRVVEKKRGLSRILVLQALDTHESYHYLRLQTHTHEPYHDNTSSTHNLDPHQYMTCARHT